MGLLDMGSPASRPPVVVRILTIQAAGTCARWWERRKLPLKWG